MLTSSQYARILSLDDQRHSIKNISKLYGYSRNTIRKVLNIKIPPSFKTPFRPSKLDDYKGCIKDEEKIFFSRDAASWHASKKLYMKVDEVSGDSYREIHKTPIVTLAPLPSCAQFLNEIESIFSGMAKATIYNSNYVSVEVCMIAVDRYFSERNQYFKDNFKRAGNKIWGKETTKAEFG